MLDIPNFDVSFTGDACVAGYGGSPAAEACSTAGPYTLSGCEAVYCPTASSGTVPGTSGTGGTSGCTVDPGYSGSVTATTSSPYYDSSIQAVYCPTASSGTVPGSSGTGGTSGCTVDPGYTGSVTATTSPPYYDSTIQAIECMSPADKSGYAVASEVLDVPNFAVSFTGGACAAFYEGTPKAEPCSAGEEYTLSGCTLIEYWYCRAGAAADAKCYPFGDNAIDENGAARPERAFPSGNWCADPGVASNDGYSCGEGDDPKGGHDASYSSFQDYCSSWSSNGGTFNGGKGQCPAGTCCY